MPYQLLWWPDADAAIAALENDPNRSAGLQAVRITLGRLEIDPFAARLGTRQFQTTEFGHIRATPCRFDDWYVLWQVGQANDEIEIVMVAELSL